MGDGVALVVKGLCRRCGSAVEATAPGPVVIRRMGDCARCGYRTFLRDDPFEIPFSESFAPLLQSDEVAAAFSLGGDVAAVCMRVIEQSLDRLGLIQG